MRLLGDVMHVVANGLSVVVGTSRPLMVVFCISQKSGGIAVAIPIPIEERGIF